MSDLTERALALIDRAGAAAIRSDVLAKHLECPQIAAYLKPKVDDGTLVCCKVINPATGREVNEYRRSVSAGGKAHEIIPRPGRPRTRGDAEVLKRIREDGLREPPASPTKAAPAIPVLAEQKPPAGAPAVRGSARDHARGARTVLPAASPEQKDGAAIGEIEKGVPIPVRNNNGRLRAALVEMAPGDSRVVKFTKQSILYAANKAGVKVCTRTEGDHTRVWRKHE